MHTPSTATDHRLRSALSALIHIERRLARLPWPRDRDDRVLSGEALELILDLPPDHVWTLSKLDLQIARTPGENEVP
jgi:hypothetical protein